MTFLGAGSGAPFPSALFYLGPHVARFVDAFATTGEVRPPAYNAGRVVHQVGLL